MKQLLLLALLVAIVACDTATPTPRDLEPYAGLSDADAALVVEAFEAVEALSDAVPTAHASKRSLRTLVHHASASVTQLDTTLYTGYVNAAGHGYLATVTYREPRGVPLWRLRLQHGTKLNGNPTDPDAVETVALAFVTYADLDSFLADLEAGTIAYLNDTSDPDGSFATADEWSVTRLTAVTDGGAVLAYTTTERRDELVVRDPIITIAADGSATVRDGLATGSVRTRYFLADFAVDAAGAITSGTLERTLTSYGEATTGSIVSRTDYPDGSFVQTTQRGGDGVVIRETTDG
ncbi:MAG: hypothetical protein RhofKO_31960 [Rhodothermales bacterium]